MKYYYFLLLLSLFPSVPKQKQIKKQKTMTSVKKKKNSLLLAFLYFEFCIPHSSLQLKNWIARTHVLGFHSYSLGNKMRMYPSVQNARKPSLANEDMQFNLRFLEATSIVRLYTSFTRNRWPSKKRKSYSTTFNIELSRRRIFLVSLFQSRPSVRQTIFLQQ